MTTEEPDPMTNQFAQAIGVNARQPFAFDLKAPAHKHLRSLLEEATDAAGGRGMSRWEIRGLTTYQAVIGAATVVGTREPEFGPIYYAALGLHRSISSARLCPVASMRIQGYSPFQVCELLERIVAEVPSLTTAAVDEWLRAHAAEL